MNGHLSCTEKFRRPSVSAQKSFHCILLSDDLPESGHRNGGERFETLADDLPLFCPLCWCYSRSLESNNVEFVQKGDNSPT